MRQTIDEIGREIASRQTHWEDQAGNSIEDWKKAVRDLAKELARANGRYIRAEAALDKITRHPDCHRLIMQIACEALERKEG